MPVVTVGKPLREKLGEDGVDALVALINESRVEQKNEILEFVEDKFERRLSEEISTLKIELIEKFTDLDTKLSKKIFDLDKKMSEKISDGDKILSEKISDGDKKLSEKISDGDKKLSEKISDLDKKLSQKIVDGDKRLSILISETKTDIIKWMFIFWIGQISVMLGILFTFFKR